MGTVADAAEGLAEGRADPPAHPRGRPGRDPRQGLRRHLDRGDRRRRRDHQERLLLPLPRQERARPRAARGHIEDDRALLDDVFRRGHELSDDPLHAFLIGLKLFAELMDDMPNGHPGCIVTTVCYQERLFDREVGALNRQVGAELARPLPRRARGGRRALPAARAGRPRRARRHALDHRRGRHRHGQGARRAAGARRSRSCCSAPTSSCCSARPDRAAAPFLCVGAAHWDIIGRTAVPLPPGADVPGRVTRQPGGVAQNVARALAALGRPVRARRRHRPRRPPATRSPPTSPPPASTAPGCTATPARPTPTSRSRAPTARCTPPSPTAPASSAPARRCSPRCRRSPPARPDRRRRQPARRRPRRAPRRSAAALAFVPASPREARRRSRRCCSPPPRRST